MTFGSNTFNGNTFSGNTFSGNTFSGNTFFRVFTLLYKTSRQILDSTMENKKEKPV
jgi:hypothetical protein